jgi:delta24(24(1))-sterol reductase
MISHRALRDIQRCRNKYGEAWLEYERRVPYLFIPVSIVCLDPPLSTTRANLPCSMCSEESTLHIQGLLAASSEGHA